MSAGWYVLVGLAFVLVIFSVVLVHESGHFVVGKLSGIRVDEFAIGFGPKLLSRKRGETVYSLRVIPAGGFVRMAGMLGLAGEADAGERNFYRASIPKRFATVAAGVVFNFIFAALCFTVVNMAASAPWGVVRGGPAAAAGIPDGAVITAINGMAIRDTQSDVLQDLRTAAMASQGRAVPITYRSSDGATHVTSVHPELVVYDPVTKPGSSSVAVDRIVVTAIDGQAVGTGDPAAVLGSGRTVHVSGYKEKSDGSPGDPVTDVTVSGVRDGNGSYSEAQAAWLIGVHAGYSGQAFPSALANGFVQIPSFIHDTVVAVYRLATDPSLGGITGPNGFSGPIGIAEQTATATSNGFLGPGGLVFWIGFISMNLGFINMLPIPFLDGGKLFFILIEAVRRKRLEPRHEAIASAVGLALVLIFVIYVSIGDVSRAR
jgi:regulator of sigma E protease